MLWLSSERFARRGGRVGKTSERRSPSRDGHARSPALEQCESRILQSVIESVGTKYIDTKTTPPQETAFTPDGTQIRVLYKAQVDQPAGIFDDPFFFDVN